MGFFSGGGESFSSFPRLKGTWRVDGSGGDIMWKGVQRCVVWFNGGIELSLQGGTLGVK